ncbi:MAG: hypothetical protein A3D74_01785 [Candidatus Levybacteria bacterium RIFCSPHIGHO2_02_FULL_37_13]|nr:MAG: hypothetical protein A3D74_01785 [Candidatus Levybacteria bacterium RIFCSPHIGHO2_02_FULL_37_13]OGH30275.1 MAG: hypothetical protein A3E40_01130 [Candidatus Levybacteria bacterium RIFCSPHIGHO2_12_FULL_37_9]OGH39514.1 MAG: hypothetical protein A3B41_03840 [Candidatus Levybacteria bacterium RIFCSPLOWO2_01_FULL_37_26]
MEREKSFAKTIQLVEAAMSQDAHSSIDQLDLDATLTYLLAPSGIGLEETGTIFCRSKEWTRLARDRTIKALHNNTSSETQAALPINELSFNKPIIRKTKEKVVFSNNQTESSPLAVHEKHKKLIEDLKKAKTDKEKQRLLNLVTRGLYRKYAQGDNPLFVPVRKLVEEIGFHHRKMQDLVLFRETIKSAGVPMGKIVYKSKNGQKTFRYYYIVVNYDIENNDKDRATQAVYKNEDLKRFLSHPVSQVAGPAQEHLPSTSLMRNKEKFKSIHELLSELNLRQMPIKKQLAMLLADPRLIPVPIFRHENAYRYSADRHNELKQFAFNFLKSKTVK